VLVVIGNCPSAASSFNAAVTTLSAPAHTGPALAPICRSRLQKSCPPADMPDHKLMPFVEGYADKIQQLAELG